MLLMGVREQVLRRPLLLLAGGARSLECLGLAPGLGERHLGLGLRLHRLLRICLRARLLTGECAAVGERPNLGGLREARSGVCPVLGWLPGE